MKVIADICIIPLGTGLSLSTYVAECERTFTAAGLTVHMHANGTNVEGEWEVVMTALRTCHERLHEMGVPRIHTELRMGTRTDKPQTMDDKIASVQRQLRPDQAP